MGPRVSTTPILTPPKQDANPDDQTTMADHVDVDVDIDSHGSQASFLSSVLLAAGEASSEWSGEREATTTAAAAITAASTTPAEIYEAAQRALHQARQLAAVMASRLDKTVAGTRDERELAQCDTVLIMEAMRARLMGLKELAQKQGRLEEVALGQVAALGQLIRQDTPPGGGTGLSQQEQQQAAAMAAAAELKRLTIKCAALERQVQLLSSCVHEPAKASPAASSPAIRSSEGPDEPQNVEEDGNAAEVRRLRRVVEEQEELLRGLRTTLRDVCMKRDPLVEEREALRAELAQLGRAHASLQEEQSALERLCSVVQGQLGRTATRCQELETYVRFVESQQQQQPPQQITPSSSASDTSTTASSPDTATSTTSLAPSLRRPVMVHDPGFKDAGASDTPPQTQQRPGLLQWLLSFFRVFDEQEEYADEGAAGMIVV